MARRSNGVRVFKFGGSSVGSAEAVRLAASHVQATRGPVVVVVSAMQGVTDGLLAAVHAARDGHLQDAENAADAFRQRHQELITALIPSVRAARELNSFLDDQTAQLRAMCQSVCILRELTGRTQDAVVARGERMLARIFTAYLQRKVTASYVEAADVIQTEHRLGSLWPAWEACARNAKTMITPLLRKGVVVVPGFIGRGPDGEVVTLGRGGSDFSAAILAHALSAGSVTLFKEVDGLMTADPRFVPDARVVPELHYREAAELAYYGAKVLHPRTMMPLVDGGIPLFIKNTFNAAFSGTRVAGDVKPGSYPVKALTAFMGQALISLEGSGMMGVPGVAARAFGALSSAGHSVSMISQASSESSICFVVPQSEAAHARTALQHAFSAELKDGLIDSVRLQEKLAILAVVGMGMRGTPGIAARTFSALGRHKVNIVAIAQGSSELNITVAIRENQVPAALQALHSEFQLDRLRALPDMEGHQVSLAFLGAGQIARALSGQILSQRRYFEHDLGLTLQCVSVADRSGVLVEETGFPPDQLRAIMQRKAEGKPLVEGRKNRRVDLPELLDARLFPLPLHRPILVDLTASETAPILLRAMQRGFHVVLANKKPLAIPQPQFEELMRTAQECGVALRYEATVGAGLPVLDTLAKLKEAGDAVDTILGCLSGTLGYLMTQLQQGVPFSKAVGQAHALGYTEPDPREDLSGLDVGRKALILARTLGRKVELKDITVEPLFPASVSDDNPQVFLQKIQALDAEYAKKQQTAARSDKVLRYVARIGKRKITVGLEAVAMSSPMARLHGTDNQIVIHTRRYSTNPLVVTGPGAGAEVTAAGVLNDILAISASEDRRRMARRRG